MRKGPSYRRAYDAQTADLVVVGGGIVGVSVALFAAREGRRVRLYERRSLGGVATLRSGALVRTHYENRAEARLAVEGRDVFARFAELIGGDPGFRRSGFVYLPAPDELATGALEDRVGMLRQVGSDAVLADSADLREFAPQLISDGVEAAVIEPASGYADPQRTMSALLAAARDAGATLTAGEPVTRVEVRDGRVTGVETATERISTERVAICSGAWSPSLVMSLGLELPIWPTAALPATFDGAAYEGPVAIDVPNGVYFRSAEQNGLFAGLRDWSDRTLTDPDAPPPEVDAAFGRRTLDAVGRRAPKVRAARFAGGRSGPLDMTPDGRPLLGPVDGIDGLWLSCGWSGTGFKTGPAAGRALVSWMEQGRPHHPDLEEFRPSRTMQEAPVRAPH